VDTIENKKDVQVLKEEIWTKQVTIEAEVEVTRKS